MNSLLIVSDVQIFREGLAIALSQRLGHDVAQSASRQRDVLRIIRRKQPSVALIDLMIDRGPEFMAALAAEAPEVSLIAMGVGDDPNDILQCAEAGATGFVSRQASLKDLVAAIYDAKGGALHCDPKVAHLLFCHVGKLKARNGLNGQDDKCNALTRRETQILELIEQGQSNKVIARDLGVEVSTVKNHVHNLLAKMGVRRRGEAAALHRRRAL
jgi:DNA-binding NarL/FixJ family response regulator